MSAPSPIRIPTQYTPMFPSELEHIDETRVELIREALIAIGFQVSDELEILSPDSSICSLSMRTPTEEILTPRTNAKNIISKKIGFGLEVMEAIETNSSNWTSSAYSNASGCQFKRFYMTRIILNGEEVYMIVKIKVQQIDGIDVFGEIVGIELLE